MAAVGDVYLIQPACYYNSQVGYLSLHAHCVSITGAGVSDGFLAQTVDAAWSPKIIPWLPTTGNYIGTRVARVTPTKGNPVVSITSAAAGTGSGGPAPSQLAGLITLNSALVGRRGRGRAYIPFPALSMISVTTGGVSAAGITLLAALATYLQSTFTATSGGDANSFNFAVRSSKFGVAGDVVTAVSHSMFATQRRRGAYGKINARPF